MSDCGYFDVKSSYGFFSVSSQVVQNVCMVSRCLISFAGM